MSEDILELDIPITLRNLINSNNELLALYQSKLLTEINASTIEMMGVLGIRAEDGWKLDMERMVFINSPTPQDETD